MPTVIPFPRSLQAQAQLAAIEAMDTAAGIFKLLQDPATALDAQCHVIDLKAQATTLHDLIFQLAQERFQARLKLQQPTQTEVAP